PRRPSDPSVSPATQPSWAFSCEEAPEPAIAPESSLVSSAPPPVAAVSSFPLSSSTLPGPQAATVSATAPRSARPATRVGRQVARFTFDPYLWSWGPTPSGDPDARCGW